MNERCQESSDWGGVNWGQNTDFNTHLILVLRLGDCQVSSFPFTQVHQRGYKGDFFQREDRVIKSKVHDLLFSFMKR